MSDLTRIVLRTCTVDDLPAHFEQHQDLEANRMAAVPLRDREAFYAHWEFLKNSSVMLRTVVVDGDVAGHVVSWGKPDSRQVGYFYARKFWGQGIATRVLQEFLLLEPTRPLFAGVAKHNAGSLRVLEKCGFVITGEAMIESVTPHVEEFVLRLDAG